MAFDTLKQQISDYGVLIQAMQDANCSDIADFSVLKGAVGSEELIGAVILAQMEVAKNAAADDERTANEYKRKSTTTDSPFEAIYYGIMAERYYGMVEKDWQLYNEWKAKAEAFDAIEASTCGLFQGSSALRANAMSGLQSITGAYQDGIYIPDMSAPWRQGITDAYVYRLMDTDASGNVRINWTEVEKTLGKDASEITDIEYWTLAEIYLQADEEGMAKFLQFCMDKKADVEIPWITKASGNFQGVGMGTTNIRMLNKDYSEWTVNADKIGQIQARIAIGAEGLLGQMREISDSNNPDYQSAKKTRNDMLQRLTLTDIVVDWGTFRGEYQGEYPTLTIESGQEKELTVTFNECRNIGTEAFPTMSNLGESTVNIGYTYTGANIVSEVNDKAKVTFRAYFCNYSVAKDTAEFVCDEVTGELIDKGSEQLANYVGKTLGKEALGKAVGALPLLGDVTGFTIDVVMEQLEQEQALNFIDGEFKDMNEAIVYSQYNCYTNCAQYDTTKNNEYRLYSYTGEHTEEKVERVNDFLQDVLGKTITSEDVINRPNEVYGLRDELKSINVDYVIYYEELLSE